VEVPMSRWLLPLLALLAGHPLRGYPAVAPCDPDTHARAALALAVAAYHPPAQVSEYERLRARAVAEGRPLLVWVGLHRPDLERARPDCLHHHCDRFPDAAPPCVVVGRPAGGELWRAA